MLTARAILSSHRCLPALRIDDHLAFSGIFVMVLTNRANSKRSNYILKRLGSRCNLKIVHSNFDALHESFLNITKM